MLIDKQGICDNLEELTQIWLETNLQAHSFIEESYWRGNIAFVKQALPQATIYCIGQQPIQGFLGINDGLIEGLFVRKEFQKSGIGKKLIEQAKKDFHTLSLYVYAKNKNAIAFYEHMGFTITQQGIDQQTGQKEYRMVCQNCMGTI